MTILQSIDLRDVGAAITLGLGVLGLVRPHAAASFVSLRPVGPTGVSELRATYGGFFLALGAFALWTQSPLVSRTIGIAWSAAAGGRLVSVWVDGSRSGKNLGGVAFEAAIAALFLLG